MSEVNLLIPDTFGRGEATPRPEAFLAGRLSGETMGTNWSAAWYAPLGVTETTIRLSFERLFDTLIASMSTWEPASLISRYNRLAPGGRITIDPHFARVMEMSLEIARLSGGAFDPCFGGEVLRRGFGAQGIADAEAAESFGSAVWDRIFPEPGTLFQPGGVALDLSAIAKGYAVDAMAAELESHGVVQYLVEIGGEFVGRGVKPDGMPWWVDIENPYPDGAPWRLVLCAAALATSGDYRQSRLEAGRRVSHIIPAPDRACGGGDLASVSVLHESCAVADGWATALFAAGDMAGLQIAEANGLAALFQYRDAPPRLSSRMQTLLD